MDNTGTTQNAKTNSPPVANKSAETNPAARGIAMNPAKFVNAKFAKTNCHSRSNWRRRRLELRTTLRLLTSMAAAAMRGLTRAEDGQRDADGVVAAGPEQVLADDAGGAPGQREQVGQAAQVVADQGDVGGAAGDLGAGAEGDADIGLGQRGRVVDAVAGHRHDAPRLRRPHPRDLVGGAHLGRRLGDADGAGDGLRGGLGVPGDDFHGQAEPFQPRDGLMRPGRAASPRAIRPRTFLSVP